jgi:N-acetyl-alpha-D-muramate 1-phosphate uridylyltransferase
LQAVILAGGLGTRLRPYTNNLPKAMVKVLGKPFLEYEIRLLARSGADDFILCAGYLAQSIADYFGDGSKFGVKIRYSFEGDNLLGPSGALVKARPLLDEAFFVTYGDAYLSLDYNYAMSHFVSTGRLGMMVVFLNRNRFGRSDVVVKGSYVVKYDKRNQSEGMDWINYGVSFLKRSALDGIASGTKLGEEEFYGRLIERRELLAFETKNRFYEIGTPGSLSEFEKLVASCPELSGPSV